MFTRLFKSDLIYQVIFIAIVALFIWIHPFFTITTVTTAPELSPFYSLFVNFFSTNSFFALLVAFILLFIQSVLLKVAFTTNELIGRNNLLPSFIYFLMMTSSQELYAFHPLMFSNLFLIISLLYILGIYGKPDSFESVFNATLLISIASLFYFPAIYFILFIWLAFIIYRLYTWREWLISLFGICLPYLFLFTFYFMTDQLEVKFKTYIEFYRHNHPAILHPDTGNYIFFIVIGLLSLYIIFNILNRLTEKSIYYRKKVLVLSMFLIVATLSLLFSGKFFTYHLCLLFVPLSFFIPTHIQQIKRLVISEFIFYILIAAWALNILL